MSEDSVFPRKSGGYHGSDFFWGGGHRNSNIERVNGSDGDVVPAEAPPPHHGDKVESTCAEGWRIKIRGGQIKEMQPEDEEERHHERSAAPTRREATAEKKKGGERGRERQVGIRQKNVETRGGLELQPNEGVEKT